MAEALTIESDGAAVGLDQSEDEAEERGLAHSCRAEDGCLAAWLAGMSQSGDYLPVTLGIAVAHSLHPDAEP